MNPDCGDSPAIDPWLLEQLACPRCYESLNPWGGRLECARGHRYPVAGGIPILVRDDVRQTHWAATASLEHAHEPGDQPPSDGVVDPIVMEAIGATGGNLYKHLIGALPRYPIPLLQLDAPAGSRFLDIGCHWGRWCISAAKRGFRVIGLDPYLPAIQAARRVARALGVDAAFVVGDARFLPFKAASFDIVHSYSVLQHLAEDDVRTCVGAISRVLRPGGSAHVQMAQRFGALNLVQQARRGFRPPRAFEVRYWRGRDLRDMFSEAVGPTELTVDGFFSLNAQSADLDLLRPAHRVIVHASNALRRLSSVVPPLVHVADSVYVRAVNSARPA